MTQPTKPSYLLRAMDPDLWSRVKARAKLDGIPIRAIIERLLELYADGKARITARRS